ncbi:MAG: esterase [Anaerolineae bacterium]|nr:esterase [Anaerolineae bacterium]
MPKLITTLGPKSLTDLSPGLILPHEHVFVDLRTPDHPDQAEVLAEEVIALIEPELRRARAAGVVALVECTPTGVGRRVDLDLAVSQAAAFPLVVATGTYREPWIPDWIRDASEAALVDWMVDELTGSVADTGVQAAWIKLSAGDGGVTDCERKVLRAAARAGAATNAVIGSHTIRGRVVMDQLDTLESAGYTAERFIWIHTQAEPDVKLHLAAARRGLWLEYDAIGGGIDDDVYIAHIHRMLDAGYRDRVLLSHDRGWYDPAKPHGGVPRPFTYISETFLPKLAASGVDAATIVQLTRDNPFRAFAR